MLPPMPCRPCSHAARARRPRPGDGGQTAPRRRGDLRAVPADAYYFLKNSRVPGYALGTIIADQPWRLPGPRNNISPGKCYGRSV